MSARNYVDNAPQVTLSSSINTSVTSFAVSSLTGFPTSFPYFVTLDIGSASAEVIKVTAASGTTVTVVRNADGNGAFAHTGTTGTFNHTVVAQDLQEANDHINASTSVHGVTGSVVGTGGTQTLTGKTLTSPTLNTPAVVSPAFSGTATGTFHTSGNIHTDGNATIDGTATVTGTATLNGNVSGTGKLLLLRLSCLAFMGTSGATINRNDSTLDLTTSGSRLVADTPDADTLGGFVAGTPNQIKVPSGMTGTYKIWARLPYAFQSGTAASTIVFLAVTVNGSVVHSTFSQTPLGVLCLEPDLFALSAGDVIQLHAQSQLGTVALYEPTGLHTSNQQARLYVERSN